MRRLYADFSPGYAWDGRQPAALEVATATQATPRTGTLLAGGLTALAQAARPLAFLVGGTTPAHAPPYVDVAGYVPYPDPAGPATLVADTERIYLPTTAGGARARGAVSGTKPFADTGLTVTYPAGSGTGATVAAGLGLIPTISDMRVVPIETWMEAFLDRSLSYIHLNTIVINTILLRGHTKLDGGVATPNGNYDVPFDLRFLGDVGRIAADFCLAEAGELRPTLMQLDYVTKRKNAQADLDRLRKAQASVGAAPPDPAANVGGDVGLIGTDAAIVLPIGFTTSLGDFTY